MTVVFGGDGGSFTRVAMDSPMILFTCVVPMPYQRQGSVSRLNVGIHCSIHHHVDNGRETVMMVFRQYRLTGLNGLPIGPAK